MSTVLKGRIALTSLLLFIFFFSGFSALMYQVAWQRLLTVYYGVGPLSVVLIVSVYMLGLGLGALLGGYLSEYFKDKILVYFIVELLIGGFGLLSLPFLDFLGRYTAGNSYPISFFYMFIYLCIPTLLMGITLPLLTKIFNQLIQNFIDTVSLLYFVNTAGAATGAVFASYIVISFLGLDGAVYSAVIINFILAALILISKYYPETVRAGGDASVIENESESIFGRSAYILVMVTGFLAIGYEIIWFRVIGVFVKASPYAFSSILSIYLLSIAIGSFAMSKYLKKHRNIDKKNLFFLLQFLIGILVLVIFIGYYYLTKYTYFEWFSRYSFDSNPHPLLETPSLISIQAFLLDVYLTLDVFFWSIFFVSAPTVIMGASFPLIAFLALAKNDGEGRTLGTVYFFNIVGNVLGGIATGFLLLPYLGTEMTLLIFSIVGVLFGLFVTNWSGANPPLSTRLFFTGTLLICAVLLFPGKGDLYKLMHTSRGSDYEVYLEEGQEGVVMTYTRGEKVINYINGLWHGGRPGYFFTYETLEAVNYAQNVENILIIGYGTGSFVETLLKLDQVKTVTIVELNHTLMKNLKKISVFSDMLADKRINLIIEDGRRFLLRAVDKYDMVFIDPLRSTTSYSNNLYSQEFFQLVKMHLSPGGIFMIWKDEHRVIPKTVLSVFDHVKVYNKFCVASNSYLEKDNKYADELYGRLSTNERSYVNYFNSIESKHVDDSAYIERLVAPYPINRDWKPVSEYYLGLKVREKLMQ